MLWLKGVLLVTNATWRKRFSVWRNRLYLYPAPESMQRTWAFWVATGLVALLACLYAAYFIVYLTSREAAYLTHAEDLGIMDQAIWTTLHGNPLHMTICNIVHDTNCYSLNGIPRFAIHFEPILYIVALFYIPWPNPDTLLVLQSIVVATGAFPAFWLARLRLRNEWASVGIAALYLLYPAQQFAQVNDFHAVTFTASLLLFTLYFMYTRKTVWLFVFAILSMACKEEIPLVIIMFGLWSMLFQHRWRSGLALTLLAVAWAVLALAIIPRIFSPSGHSLSERTLCWFGPGLCTLCSSFSGAPYNYNQTIHPGAEPSLLPACLADPRRLSPTAGTMGIDSGRPFDCLESAE